MALETLLRLQELLHWPVLVHTYGPTGWHHAGHARAPRRALRVRRNETCEWGAPCTGTTPSHEDSGTDHHSEENAT